MNNLTIHKAFMQEAINEAKKAGQEIPVGAIIVQNGEIIARASNKKEELNDVTAHAEILAIKQAAKKINNWRLKECSLYVTLEPCPMCASAILYSRIPNVYFGTQDPLYGALGSTLNMNDYIKHTPKIMGGILENECKELITAFFDKKR